jgi:hypothetical protein
MANGLDVVAVWVENVAAVVVGVVPAQPGRAVVRPARRDRCGMEGVDLRTRLGAEGDVKPALYGFSVGPMKKDGRVPSSLPNPAAASENSISRDIPRGASAFS